MTPAFIAYPNKATENTTSPILRGTSALYGAADTVLTLWVDEKHETGHGRQYLALRTEDTHGGKNRNGRSETIHGSHLERSGPSAVFMHVGSKRLTPSDAWVKDNMELGVVYTVPELVEACGVPRCTAERTGALLRTSRSRDAAPTPSLHGKVSSMKSKFAVLAAALSVVALTGCGSPGVSDETRNDVQTAVASKLIPDFVVSSFMDGDEAAADFIEQMHELAADLTTAIIDEDKCGSSAYEAGLASSVEVLAAHEAGCAEYARLTSN